jgi:hypothetical protein
MLKRPYYPSPLIMLPYLLVGMITSPMMELPTIGPPLSLLEMLDQPFRKGYPQDTLPITTSQDVFYFRCTCDVSPLFRWNVSSLWFSWHFEFWCCSSRPMPLCHIGEVCCYFHWAEERVPHPERQPDAAAVPNSTSLLNFSHLWFPASCIRSCDKGWGKQRMI